MRLNTDFYLWVLLAFVFVGAAVCFTLLGVQDMTKKDCEYEEGACIIFPFDGADDADHTITVRLSGGNICVVWVTPTPTPTPAPTPTEVPVVWEFNHLNYARTPHPGLEDFSAYPRGDVIIYTPDAPSDPYYYRKDNNDY